MGNKDSAEIILKTEKHRADLLGLDLPAKNAMACAGQPSQFIVVEEEATPLHIPDRTGS